MAGNEQTIEHLVNLDDDESIEAEVASVNDADKDDLEIQIVEDDVPDEDKGKKIVSKKPEEVTDEELESYSDSVKKRIKKLSWESNNERRARAQAERDRDEAVQIAQVLLAEKRKAEKAAGTFAEASVTSEKQRVEISLAAARKKLKDAMETFDADAMADAQEEISSLAVQRQKLDDWTPPAKSSGHDERNDVDSRQAQPVQAPARDELAVQWAKKNTWFHVDPDMTSYALRVDKALQEKGVHPILDSAEYYKQLDRTIRAKFPDYFTDPTTETATERKPKHTSVVAGVTRSPTGKTKVVLTESQKRTASRLGITVEQYARELANLRSE